MTAGNVSRLASINPAGGTSKLNLAQRAPTQATETANKSCIAILILGLMSNLENGSNECLLIIFTTFGGIIPDDYEKSVYASNPPSRVYYTFRH